MELLDHAQSELGDPFIGVPEDYNSPFSIDIDSFNWNEDNMSLYSPPQNDDDLTFLNEFFQTPLTGYSLPLAPSPLGAPVGGTFCNPDYPETPSSAFSDDWVSSGGMTPGHMNEPYNVMKSSVAFDDYAYETCYVPLDSQDDEIPKEHGESDENDAIEAARAHEKRLDPYFGACEETIEPVYKGPFSALNAGIPTVIVPKARRRRRNRNASSVPKKCGIPYPYLAGLALKNSKDEYEPVRMIYNFVSYYFHGYDLNVESWKKSLRHVLSSSVFFERGPVEKPLAGAAHGTWRFSKLGREDFDAKLLDFAMQCRDRSKFGLKTPGQWEALMAGEMGIPSTVEMPRLSQQPVVRKEQGQKNAQARLAVSKEKEKRIKPAVETKSVVDPPAIPEKNEIGFLRDPALINIMENAKVMDAAPRTNIQATGVRTNLRYNAALGGSTLCGMYTLEKSLTPPNNAGGTQEAKKPIALRRWEPAIIMNPSTRTVSGECVVSDPQPKIMYTPHNASTQEMPKLKPELPKKQKMRLYQPKFSVETLKSRCAPYPAPNVRKIPVQYPVKYQRLVPSALRIPVVPVAAPTMRQ